MRVKGLMPPEGGTSRETPTGRAVGEVWHGITFLAVRTFVMPLDNFIGFTTLRK